MFVVHAPQDSVKLPPSRPRMPKNRQLLIVFCLISIPSGHAQTNASVAGRTEVADCVAPPAKPGTTKAHPVSRPGPTCGPVNISITNSVGNGAAGPGDAASGVAGGAANAPGNAEFYKSLSDNVSQTAKAAIDAGKDNVDVVKWIFTAVSALLTILGLALGWFGVKSIREMKDDVDSKLKAKFDEVMADGKKLVEKSMKALSDGTFLSHFITSAQSKSELAEQIERAMQGVRLSDVERDQYRLSFESVISTAKNDLVRALAYLPGADEKIVVALVSQVMKNEDAVAGPTITPRVNLESWVYGTLAWLSKRVGNIAQAIQYAKKAHELYPSDYYPLYNLACYHAIAGTMDESLSALRGAVERNPALVNDLWDEDDLAKLRDARLSDFMGIAGKKMP